MADDNEAKIAAIHCVLTEYLGAGADARGERDASNVTSLTKRFIVASVSCSSTYAGEWGAPLPHPRRRTYRRRSRRFRARDDSAGGVGPLRGVSPFGNPASVHIASRDHAPPAATVRLRADAHPVLELTVSLSPAGCLLRVLLLE